MDKDEKLSLFRELVFEQIGKNEAEQLASYEASLKKVYEDHKREKISKDKIVLETDKEIVRKERNKQHAQIQLQMQHDLHKEQQKLKEAVFEQVRNRLDEFKKTETYLNLLERQVNQALSIANGEQMDIYVDPDDAEKVVILEERTGHKMTVLDRPFIGGIQGVIQSRNMLVDYTLLKRLEAEYEDFSFDLIKEGDDI